MRLVAQGEDDTRAAVSLRKAILRLFIYLNFILYEKMVYMVLTDGGQVKLAFSKRTAVFGAGGGAVSINVDAAGAWSAAQPEAGWLEVEYDATSMRLHAEANPSPEVRQAEVVVTTGDYTATIDVAQEPAEPVTLDVKGPESYVFDSEGGEILLSVASNAAWTASVDQTWCVLSTDPERGLATLTVAEPNTGDKTLTATLTVEAGTEVNGAKQTFSLSQQMRGENPYFRIPGTFSITADHWMLRGVDQGAGTRGSCVIEVDLYNQYFNLSALTFDGQGEPMRMEALALNLPYNREECYVSIPLGQLLATFEEKDMMVYLVAINVKNSTFTTGSGAVTGVVSDDFRTITLHGLPEEYQTLGLISRKISDTSQVGMFGDIYYPSGEGIVLAREAASASPASLPVAFSSVQRGDVVRLRAHTTGRINRIEQFN